MRTVEEVQKERSKAASMATIPLLVLTTYSDRDAKTEGDVFYISDRTIETYDYGNIGTQRRFNPWLLNFGELATGMTHIPSAQGGELLSQSFSLTLRNMRWPVDASGERVIELLRANYPLEMATLEVGQILVPRYMGPYPIDLSAYDGDEHTVFYRCKVSRLGPITEDEIQIQCTRDSPEIEWTRADDATKADPRDLGARYPKPYGPLRPLPLVAQEVGWQTTLAESITSATADDIRFSDLTGIANDAGSGRIDAEEIAWTSKSGNTLNGVTRAQSGTSAVAHRAGSQLVELIATSTFIASDGEVSAIEEVYALDALNGSLARVTTGYTATLTAPAKVTFSQAQMRLLLDEMEMSSSLQLFADVDGAIVPAPGTNYDAAVGELIEKPTDIFVHWCEEIGGVDVDTTSLATTLANLENNKLALDMRTLTPGGWNEALAGLAYRCRANTVPAEAVTGTLYKILAAAAGYQVITSAMVYNFDDDTNWNVGTGVTRTTDAGIKYEGAGSQKIVLATTLRIQCEATDGTEAAVWSSSYATLSDEAVIKTEGTHSIKGVSTSSSYVSVMTLYPFVPSIDLTAGEKLMILFDIRVNRNGAPDDSNIMFQIGSSSPSWGRAYFLESAIAEDTWYTIAIDYEDLVEEQGAPDFSGWDLLKISWNRGATRVVGNTIYVDNIRTIPKKGYAQKNDVATIDMSSIEDFWQYALRVDADGHELLDSVEAYFDNTAGAGVTPPSPKSYCRIDHKHFAAADSWLLRQSALSAAGDENAVQTIGICVSIRGAGIYAQLSTTALTAYIDNLESASLILRYPWPDADRTITVWQSFGEAGPMEREVRTRQTCRYDFSPVGGPGNEENYEGFLRADEDSNDLDVPWIADFQAAVDKYGNMEAAPMFLDGIDDEDTAKDVFGYYVSESLRAPRVFLFSGCAWWEIYDLEEGDIIDFTHPWSGDVVKARVLAYTKRFATEQNELRCLEVE